MSIENTLAERGARYGDFTHHAELAQGLQFRMQTFCVPADNPDGYRVPWKSLSNVQKQALTVIADKIARILSGDPNYTDNWHDIQGYAKLAEDRCVADEGPQLPFPPVSDGRSFDTFGGDPVRLPNERDPLAGQHHAHRQGDEFFCPRCNKRWGVDEPAPGCRE